MEDALYEPLYETPYEPPIDVTKRMTPPGRSTRSNGWTERSAGGSVFVAARTLPSPQVTTCLTLPASVSSASLAPADAEALLFSPSAAARAVADDGYPDDDDDFEGFFDGDEEELEGLSC